MGDTCVPVWCSASGPGTPFGTWYIAVFDSIRLVTILGAFALMLATGMAWNRSVKHGGQRDRYLALAAFAVAAIGTEIQNMGNLASYRLALFFIGTGLALRGLWRFRSEQPAPRGGYG
jgi:hypothetical protein